MIIIEKIFFFIISMFFFVLGIICWDANDGGLFIAISIPLLIMAIFLETIDNFLLKFFEIFSIK